MAASASAQLEIAAALVRLYVFLSQYLDRCLMRRPDEYPDGELQTHLAETRLAVDGHSVRQSGGETQTDTRNVTGFSPSALCLS